MICSFADNRPVVLQVRSSNATGGGAEPLVLDALGYRALCAYMHPPGDGEVWALHASPAGGSFASMPCATRPTITCGCVIARPKSPGGVCRAARRCSGQPALRWRANKALP